ncbi:Stp1/IreP family PP2C-type Ser/Thr phosphatase [Chitinolyticbacter meiyuanensis]|uniref:Stp1/IreP family PP2C-type Ser/Thr phosphatase n=1 Tax=Chitinolyticbacter meiyuanensis TaxID=682798 RepID=UPI00165297A2|nr:Stp1/IreP family PP2C-type Ser/Thr phosphatase [Chitinolyticbacter meiyuanensis]
MADLSRILQIEGATDPGLVRDHNEDAIGFDPMLGFAVLADGMGGYLAGEVASGMAIEMMLHVVRGALQSRSAHQLVDAEPYGHQVLEDAVQQANAAIYGTALSQPQCAGMGTTVVATLFYDDRVLAAHVGDSRLYRLRGEMLEQLTRDHSFLQEQIDSGLITPEEARHSQNRNLVTRAVGIDPLAEVELAEHPVEVGDLYLLCSDGLTDMLDDEHIADLLVAMRANLPLAAQQLVLAANDAGGRDNISVLLIEVKKPFPGKGAIWTKVSSLLRGTR